MATAQTSSTLSRFGFIPAFLIITGVTFVLYHNTFNAPFQFDDYFYIADNRNIRDLTGFWPPLGTRYVGYLSFALNYHFAGNDLFSYHLTNTVIHLVNGLLVYFLVSIMFRTPWMEGSKVKDREYLGFALPLTASLLFIAHPVQTEAVTYLTQRFASLAALFYILAITLYLKSRLSRAAFAKALCYGAALASAVIAQKTKEISFTLPFVIALFEFTFFDSKGSSPAKRTLGLVPFLLTAFIIPFDVFGPELGLYMRDSLNEMVRKYQMKDLAGISRLDYLMTQMGVILKYLRLLVLPVSQNADYDIKLLSSPADPGVYGPFLALLAAAAASVFIFIRARASKNGYLLLMAFGAFWFFMTISIESSVIPIKDIMVEHRLYLPGIGAFMTFAALVFFVFGKLGLRASNMIAASMLILLVIPLGKAAYERNKLWTDVVSMCEDVAAKSPNKASAHYLLGNAYYERNRLEDAAGAYENALRLDPKDAFIHYKLWNVYEALGRMPEAIEHFQGYRRIMSGGH